MKGHFCSKVHPPIYVQYQQNRAIEYIALVKEAGLANEEAPFVIIVIYHYIIICVLTHDTRLQVYCLQLWPSVGTLVAHYRLLEAAADQGNL